MEGFKRRDKEINEDGVFIETNWETSEPTIDNVLAKGPSGICIFRNLEVEDRACEKPCKKQTQGRAVQRP